MGGPYRGIVSVRKLLRTVMFLSLFLCALSSCTKKKADLGSEGNPIKLFFVPSVDVQVLEDTSRTLKGYLEKNTPYKFKVSIPPSFIAVVEAFGTHRADVAGLNTYGYILAYEKYGVEARLTTVRNGSATYKGQFIARNNGKIKTVADLTGKKVAFVDPASTSGYVLPQKLLNDRHIKPKETIFAMRHDNVVSMVYQGQVDAGATFYVAPIDGKIQDARMLVKSQYPDVEDKIKIIEFTEPIPNDPVVFRKDLPENMKQAISQALIEYVKTPEGRETLQRLSGVTGLTPATDKDYDKTREFLKAIGQPPGEIKK